MEPGACLARRVEEATEGGDLESIHAGASGGEHDHDEQLSGNVLDRVHRYAGDAAAALASSDAVVSGTFRTPWVYQAYIEPQAATAWLEPDGTLAVSVATQGSLRQPLGARPVVRPAARQDQDHRRAAGRRLRGKVRARRAAGRRRGARARAARSPRDDAAGGLRRHEPGLGAGDRARDRRARRRHADRHSRPDDRRPRLERRLGRRRHHLAARRSARTGGKGSTCAGTACRRTASRSAPTAGRERRRPRSPWRR